VELGQAGKEQAEGFELVVGKGEAELGEVRAAVDQFGEICGGEDPVGGEEEVLEGGAVAGCEGVEVEGAECGFDGCAVSGLGAV